MKTYLIGRLSSLTAWLGLAVLAGEFLLHMGNVSTLMVVLAVLLVVLPEDRIRAVTEGWAKDIKAWADED